MNASKPPQAARRPLRQPAANQRAKTLAIPWESRVELRGYFHAEVDATVVSYRAQPHTLQMLYRGQRWTYTPDREDRRNQVDPGHVVLGQ